MEYADKIKALTANGFTLDANDQALKKELDKETDRFTTALYVYVDDLDHVYINQYKSNGLRTVTDNMLLTNHNQCHTHAKQQYVNLLKQLPFLSSAVSDQPSPDPLPEGESQTVTIGVDPYFITLQVLAVHYSKLINTEPVAQSTQLALRHVLYSQPLTEVELDDMWQKWKDTYDTHSDSDSITITGDSKQIDQLFHFIYDNERYQVKKKQVYLEGIDYEYAVVDKQAEVVEPSDFGEHYATIIKLINQHHEPAFTHLTQDEKDTFILSNFDLIGKRYENKNYYVKAVNEAMTYHT